RELTGDSGFAARIEASAPVMEPSAGVRFHPYLFVDHGRVSNHKGLPCRGTAGVSCSVTGAGVGARVNMGTSTSATLDIARALKDGITTSSGDVRGHVSINFVF
ncbi:MAG: hypothetical protein NDJ19_11570, partial [Ramlibacter sp.]|nr:hypothetical protein [Ramlibacter sp.]